MNGIKQFFNIGLVGSITAFSSISSTYLHAQENQNATHVLLEEVVVTARKREESVMTVPVSMSAYNSAQLEILKVRDIQSLSVGLPNVALDDVGTTKGVANFSIRGLGINSSIPSIDPTVGTFIDGVYLGTNVGVVFDVFDLESIEVLRGPQGTLFGRNVTGGAVLLNSAKPSAEFEGSVKVAIEGGGEELNHYAMASIGGPVSNTLSAKLSLYTNQDDGYFLNRFNNEPLGAQDTVSVRPMLVWTPNDRLSITAIYDYFDSNGDGPAAQNHINGSGVSNSLTNFDRHSFDLSIDTEGFFSTQSDFFRTITEYKIDQGTITNIFGYRQLNQAALSDIDATPINLFDGGLVLNAKQISHELRYSGALNDTSKLTAGLYYFQNELDYDESRRLLGLVAPTGLYGLTQDGGGLYDVKTLGAFASMDYSLNDALSINLGIRYTDEEKNTKIASLIRNVNSVCSVVEGSCAFDFNDRKSWKNVSPKIGFNYAIHDKALTYGSWTRGFRSGGYNLRNTAIDTDNFGPGPFNEERVQNIEFGYKTTLTNGARLTAAVFHNQIDDMQRELNFADPTSGTVQVIRNTADASISGIELDAIIPITDRLLLNASVGYINPEYDEVRFDLNGDGVINGDDLDLDIPRAADLTYAFNLTLDTNLGNWGTATSRISYAYRDESVYTDNNLGFNNEVGIVDMGIDFYSNDGAWVLALYGKNLNNEVRHGGDTQLPSFIGSIPLGGTFSPLAKGRTYGAEVSYRF